MLGALWVFNTGQPAVIIVTNSDINITTTFQVFHVYEALSSLLLYLHSQEPPEVCHLEIIIFTYVGENKTLGDKVICSRFMAY